MIRTLAKQRELFLRNFFEERKRKERKQVNLGFRSEFRFLGECFAAPESRFELFKVKNLKKQTRVCISSQRAAHIVNFTTERHPMAVNQPLAIRYR